MTEADIQYRGYTQYEYSFVPINKANSFKPICNDVTFVNQGATIMWINGTLRILPNQSYTFPGYPGEICTHTFDISFTGAGNSNAVMVTKNYPAN